MLRVLVVPLALLIMLLPVALSAPQAPEPVPQPSIPDLFPKTDQPMDGPLKYTQRLLESGDPNGTDGTLLTFAYLEQGGHLPMGFTDSVAEYQDAMAQQPRLERPPVRMFRDASIVCDVDEDGINDVIVNQIDRATLQTSVHMYSGVDGNTQLWSRFGQLYLESPAPPGFLGVYAKQGRPLPTSPENLEPTLDVNNDGVCDFILFGVTVTQIGLAGQAVRSYVFTFNAVNGSWGFNSGPGFWSFQERSTMVISGDPILGTWLIIQIQNFMSGFDGAFTPNGHRFVVKTTDVSFTLVADPVTGCPVFDWRTSEHIQYRNGLNGRKLWQRDLNGTREDDATGKSADPTGSGKETNNNITYLTGLVQLAGDDEAEVVLHQWQFTTPRTCNVNGPFGPIFNYGTSASVLALRGEIGRQGADLWRSVVYDNGAYRVNVAAEESFETFIWIYNQILPDYTGDGVPEIFPSYLMQEQNSPTSPNGAFRTHIKPLDGATGKELIPKVDLRQQGWGFSAWMGVDPTKPVQYFAFGSVDFPTAVPPAGRFPPKDVRITVFDISDGSPLWSWREQFPQDSYLSFHITLNQYLNSLAPNDYNQDGLRDLLTPSQYVQAGGANQTLMAQSTNVFQTLNGVDGEPIHKITAWGPTGIAHACTQDDTGLTLFTGHSRRLDVTRFELGFGNKTVTQMWRVPIFNNPDFQAATQGTDIASWHTKCIIGMDERVLFNSNAELVSSKRGLEIKSVFGMIDDNELLWQLPPVEGNPPISLDELLRYFEIEQPSPALTLALTAGPVVPGVIAGVGLGRLRARKGGL